VIERRNRGRCERDRNARRNFEQVSSELRGIIGSAARYQHNELGAAARSDFPECFRAAQARAESARKRGWLLADFFDHSRHVLFLRKS
jgi:hypothetical protein